MKDDLMKRLRELRALEAAATKGPWIVRSTSTERLMASVVTKDGQNIALIGAINPDEANANAEFIEACRRVVPDMLTHIEQLTAEVERLREALEPFATFAASNVDDEGWNEFGLSTCRERKARKAKRLIAEK